MSITVKKKDPKEFVIALYTRTNESFPSKLDVMVNGHVGVLVDSQPCILPRFLVEQAIQANNFTHRKNPDGDNDTYVTVSVRPNISTTEIDEEYQSAEGIRRLLDDASKIKNPESPYYRLRQGCKDLVFGDMRPKEKEASEAVKSSPKAINMENMELKSQLFDSMATIKAQDERMNKLEAMLEKVLSAGLQSPAIAQTESKVEVEQIEDDESDRTFAGKVYKTVSARKAAESKAAKLEPQEEIADGLEEIVEEEVIEVDV